MFICIYILIFYRKHHFYQLSKADIFNLIKDKIIFYLSNLTILRFVKFKKLFKLFNQLNFNNIVPKSYLLALKNVKKCQIILHSISNQILLIS